MKDFIINKDVNKHALTLLELLYYYSNFCSFNSKTRKKILDLINYIEHEFNLSYDYLNFDVDNEFLQLIVSSKNDF